MGAIAADLLPYSTRTNSYNGWSTDARGDIRTVGMSGATVGLGDTFIATLDSPSGLAMTLNGADSNFADNHIYDRSIQNFNNPMNVYNLGVAFNGYPWGYSLGYVVPYSEGQQYSLVASPNNPLNLSVSTSEFHLTFARLLLDNRVSVGLSLVLGQAQEQIDSLSTQTSTAFHSYALGATFGSTLNLGRHVLLGLSYSLPMHYAVSAVANPTPSLPGFFEPIEVPSRIGMGIGWIPNRFFRADFSTFVIGSTPSTALLADNSVSVGEATTVQPKIGLAYNFIDFKELKGTGFLGSYYETSRIAGVNARLHETTGIEVKPWILTVGWALDYASNYRNYIFSLGVDIFAAMAKLDIIPTAWQPPSAGIAPKPTTFSDEGLPRPIVKNWQSHGPDMNPFKVGLDIPKNIQKKATEIGETVGKTAKEIGNNITGILYPEKTQPPKSISKNRPHRRAPKNKSTIKVE